MAVSGVCPVGCAGSTFLRSEHHRMVGVCPHARRGEGVIEPELVR